jgi:trehalose 6-phosphate phosphatase
MIGYGWRMQTLPHNATLLGPLKGHALFLDVDGTLIDLAPTPEAVEVPLTLIPLLQRLAHQLKGAIAFVSGRTIDAIDTLFAPLKIPAVGVHGGEIRGPDGRVVAADRGLADQIQAAEPALREAVAGMRGVVLENKHSALALHYRSVPERGREVLKIAELLVGNMGGQFAVLMGKCVVEIRPRHLTKGTAIDALMQQPPFHGCTPIFAGDDCTDEDAFEVVNRLGGISVHVGASAQTRARHRLAGPDELRGWLQQLSDAQDE